VRRCDDARVDLADVAGAHDMDFLVLENPQQFALQIEAGIADLVQKNGPAVGDLKKSGPGILGPGESAFDVAEQFAFDERIRNGRAVDGHEARRGPVAAVVNRPRDKLFAGTAFTMDEDIGADGGRPFDALNHVANTVGYTDQAIGLGWRGIRTVTLVAGSAFQPGVRPPESAHSAAAA
jgi:hypothetical protein